MFDLSSFIFCNVTTTFCVTYIPFVAVLEISFGLCIYVFGGGVGLG